MVYTKTAWVASTAPGISATNLNNLETQYDSAVVIGEVKLYCGTAAPTNFFLCNGTSKDATVYPELFAVTSRYFGGTALSSYFHLPDLQGKFICGYSTTVGSTYETIGVTAGTSEVILTVAQMPAHTHTVPSSAGGGVEGYGLSPVIGTTNQASGSAGGGTAHENRPPFVVLNYIIRYQ